MTDKDKIREVKERRAAELLRMANVVGVAIGYKEEGGRKTDTLCLVVMVSKKVPRSQLLDKDVIPPELDTVITDVQEVGKIAAL